MPTAATGGADGTKFFYTLSWVFTATSAIGIAIFISAFSIVDGDQPISSGSQTTDIKQENWLRFAKKVKMSPIARCSAPPF
jgi:hypothetical protein